MFTLLRSSRKEDIVAQEDDVVLADGSHFVVPRTNLVAAKALLAAQRAAERRIAERQAVAIERSTDKDRQCQAIAS